MGDLPALAICSHVRTILRVVALREEMLKVLPLLLPAEDDVEPPEPLEADWAVAVRICTTVEWANVSLAAEIAGPLAPVNLTRYWSNKQDHEWVITKYVPDMMTIIMLSSGTFDRYCDNRIVCGHTLLLSIYWLNNEASWQEIGLLDWAFIYIYGRAK